GQQCERAQDRGQFGLTGSDGYGGRHRRAPAQQYGHSTPADARGLPHGPGVEALRLTECCRKAADRGFDARADRRDAAAPQTKETAPWLTRRATTKPSPSSAA